MYGLEAISAYNGWAMALAGAFIVLSGLSVLSIIISQFNKVVTILEYRAEKKKQIQALSAKHEAEDRQEVIIPDRFPSEISEAATIYQPLIDQLEQPFRLSKLYEISQKNKFPHPYLTIRNFREEGMLVNQGDGYFSWNQ